MHVSWVNYLVASKTMQSPTAESRMLVETQGRESDTDLWVVVIGRNEGERLTRCFDSIRPTAAVMVYVDSASTDDSVSAARERGIEVVELDMSIPFTAARARNAGFARLKQTARPARWIQFIDGDCEVVAGWLDGADLSNDARPVHLMRSLRLAVEHQPAALVLRSPFASLTLVGQHHYPMLPVALLLRDRYPSIDRAPRIQCPVLVIAGTRDLVIPTDHTRRLYDAIVAAKTFVEIEADHNDAALLDGTEMMNAIIGFIGKASRTSQ